MIELPSGVNINNLIDDLRIFSWEASDILINYSQILKDSNNRSNILLNGKNEDPLYTFIKDKKRGVISKNITWNFTKFLCVDGIPVDRFGPRENPKSFENKIIDYLNRDDDL